MRIGMGVQEAVMQMDLVRRSLISATLLSRLLNLVAGAGFMK